LRQWKDSTSGTTRLFEPSTAIRVHPAGFTGTPLPKDEPTAENPPFGARLDYQLASTPKTPVTLAIHDEAGQLVRTYSSADRVLPYKIATAGTAPEWFKPPTTLATTPGLHRFIWPLRYPALPALADGNAYADGAWALPGHYVIALTVDGHTYRQPLTVAPDPRVRLPQDAYVQQFAFARKVESAQARLAVAQGQARELHKMIPGTKKSNPSADALLTSFDQKIVGIAGINDTPNPNNGFAFPPKTTHSLAFLSQALGKLANASDDADALPSADAIRGYEALAPMLDRALSGWKTLQSNDLPALNTQLRGAGIAELKPAAESTSKP
jgi:hypothetical protein